MGIKLRSIIRAFSMGGLPPHLLRRNYMCAYECTSYMFRIFLKRLLKICVTCNRKHNTSKGVGGLLRTLLISLLLVLLVCGVSLHNIEIEHVLLGTAHHYILLSLETFSASFSEKSMLVFLVGALLVCALIGSCLLIFEGFSALFRRATFLYSRCPIIRALSSGRICNLGFA